jgi:DNA-binding transcriptional MerR regulator
MVTIGEAARTSGLTPFRVRWYADHGLLGPVTREGRRRLFSRQQVERLARIRAWRDQELSLDDVRTLLGLTARPLPLTLGERLVELVAELHERTLALKTLAEANLAEARQLHAPASGSTGKPTQLRLPPITDVATGRAESSHAVARRADGRNGGAS